MQPMMMPQFAFLTWDAALGRRMCPLAAFGSRVPVSLTSRLVCVDPPRADCDTLANAEAVCGAVALVVRGGCSFAQKARRIQAAGAVAMILANNTRDEPFAAFTMGESDDDHRDAERALISIPCVMMSLYDVRELFKQFPPSVQTGTMHIEVLDMATHDARAALDACSRQRQLVMQQSDASDTGDLGRHGGSGWGAIKRWKPSALMKLLDPSAAAAGSSAELSAASSGSVVEYETSEDDRSDSATSAPINRPTDLVVMTQEAPCVGSANADAPSVARTAPLFAFVQWATAAASYELHYAPLADFGLAANDAVYDGRLVACDPILADTPVLRNTNALTGAVALVQRGACPFPTKLERIQRAGAVAAIVGNDDTASPDAAFVMSVDHIPVDHITIPSVMVPLRVFEQLQVQRVSRVRIMCVSGASAAVLMAQAGRATSLLELSEPTAATNGGGPTDANDESALKLFHAACRAGEHGACQRILDEHCAGDSERTAMARAHDAHRLTALHHACASGNEHIVALLIQLGAALDASDWAMQTPLHVACLRGHVSCVRVLVKAAAAESAAAVTTAVMVGHSEHTLTARRNIGGSTPLHYAAASGSTECLEVLLTANARVDADGQFRFDDVSLADNDGATPLHVACRHAEVDCALYLLAANAEVDAVDTSGRTAVHLCCEVVNDPALEAPALHLIEKLVAAGANLCDATVATPSQQQHQLDASLVLDYIESATLRRELEVLHLRVSAQRAQQHAVHLALANTHLARRVDTVETQLQRVVAQSLAVQTAETARREQLAAQQTQLDQLHVQIATVVQVLRAQSEGVALPGASLFASALRDNGFDAATASATLTRNSTIDDETLAQEAALARDLGRKCVREQQFATAEMYLDKSLELYALPGVRRLRDHVRTLRVDSEQQQQQLRAGTSSDTSNNRPPSPSIGKLAFVQQLRAALTQSQAPPSAVETVEREISKLAALREGSSEYHAACRWLEWLVALPWGDPVAGLQPTDLCIASRDVFDQIDALEHAAHDCRRQRAARIIQRAARKWLSATAWYRSVHCARIQALARGFLARRQCHALRRHAECIVNSDDQASRVVIVSSFDASSECAAATDLTDAPLNYARELDPLARARLRHVAQPTVLAGVELVRGSPITAAFYVLQVLQSAPSAASRWPDALAMASSQSLAERVYYVWSRWGVAGAVTSAATQCTLSGPYEQLETAMHRYERVLREQQQKAFVVASLVPAVARSTTFESPSRQHKHYGWDSSAERRRWSPASDVPAPSRVQIPTFSA